MRFPAALSELGPKPSRKSATGLGVRRDTLRENAEPERTACASTCPRAEARIEHQPTVRPHESQTEASRSSLQRARVSAVDSQTHDQPWPSGRSRMVSPKQAHLRPHRQAVPG